MRTLEDLCDWANSHKASCDIRWQHQADNNKVIQHQLDSVKARLTSVEKKLLVVTSIAAAVGSTLGSLLQNLHLFK